MVKKIVVHGQAGGSNIALRVLKFLAENERLLVVAASTCIMSLSHTALRPVLPVFAKVEGPACLPLHPCCKLPVALHACTEHCCM